MAKRSRGTRPGQRGRLIRRAARPAGPIDRPGVAAPAPSGGLTEAEETRAAALEAQIMAEERAAETSRSRAAKRSTEPDETFRSRSRESGMLTVRTAEEIVVVRRDIRHILLIDGGLVAFLIGLWIVASATGILRF
jgi:hypothetical protein